jgi:hypothetical protein
LVCFPSGRKALTWAKNTVWSCPLQQAASQLPNFLAMHLLLVSAPDKMTWLNLNDLQPFLLRCGRLDV